MTDPTDFGLISCQTVLSSLITPHYMYICAYLLYALIMLYGYIHTYVRIYVYICGYIIIVIECVLCFL